MNYFNHLTVHRAENIRKLKGWRSNFNGSQDYDLNLRVIEKVPPSKIRHIPKVLYHWRSIKGSTAFSQDEKNYAYQAGLIALAEHIDRCKLAATVEPIPDIPFYRFRYHLPKPEPMVSLIIPTRDNVVLLKQCISSILQRTDYNNYEILIIDNNSIDPKTHEYFKIITSQNNNISVLPYHEGFNYSSINNFAVQYAQGQILGLINNDVEVISSDWLKEMASLAMRPDIGCVGAKLYYPDNTIQHGGVILGLGGVAGHAHKYFTREAPGYFHRLRVLHNLSAVTGACLLIRKHIFEQVGGLEQNNLAVAFNDVDLCLRVRKAGYLNLFTPFAELYHHESISRGKEDTEEKRARFQRELTYMRKYWGNELNYDPYYSPNLSLDTEDFAIRK